MVFCFFSARLASCDFRIYIYIHLFDEIGNMFRPTGVCGLVEKESACHLPCVRVCVLVCARGTPNTSGEKKSGFRRQAPFSRNDVY